MGRLRRKWGWAAYLIVAAGAICQGGCLLVAAGAAANFGEGVEVARASIDTGASTRTLQGLIEESNRVP